MHADDAVGLDIEILIKGTDPFNLYEDTSIIPVPGHTKGSVVIKYKSSLFTGDHLAWSDFDKRLIAWINYCWFDWDTQIEFMEKLVELSFDAVYPGHGRRIKLETEQMKTEMSRCVQWMKDNSK